MDLQLPRSHLLTYSPTHSLIQGITMHSRLALVIALVAASPLTVRAAACQSKSSTPSLEEPRIIVPFAVPIGLPVATFAPYFYSAAQFQPQTSLVTGYSSFVDRTSFTSTRDKGPTTNDQGPETRNLIATRCASCHSGPSPKANLSFDNPNSLTLPDRLRAIRAIASGQMPKGTQLTDQEIRALIQELSRRE
jgi:mono/diheme cytochrome c family protein